MSVITRQPSGRWGAAGASRTVIVVALEHVATFPAECRQTNLTGNIVRCTRLVLFQKLRPELDFEDAVDTPKDLAEVEDLIVALPDRTDAGRVMSITVAAVSAGTITPRHAEVVLTSRLGGVPIRDVAVAGSRQPLTVPRIRQRIERLPSDEEVA